MQKVEIPLANFAGLDPNENVGTLHTRFGYNGLFVVDITSIAANAEVNAALARPPAHESDLLLIRG